MAGQVGPAEPGARRSVDLLVGPLIEQSIGPPVAVAVPVHVPAGCVLPGRLVIEVGCLVEYDQGSPFAQSRREKVTDIKSDDM